MATIEAAVTAQWGPRFIYRQAAIDSLRWSIETGRPADEAIRGLANATSPGPNAPSQKEITRARAAYMAALP